SGQGAALRKSHLLPDELVTYATGPGVQTSGPRVKEFRGEEALLAKFLQVSDPKRVVVCYTQGHGEPAFDSLEPYRGYAHLRDLMREANLEVRPADLDRVGGLTECDVLLVAGPEGRLPAKHIAAVEAHAEQGGELLLLTGAVLMRGSNELAPHGLEPLAARYGIKFRERLVLDPHPVPGATPLLAFTLQSGWGDHPATQSLLGRAVSLMQVRELVLAEPAASLLETTEESWAESRLHEIARGIVPDLDASVDRPGPIVVAAASEYGGSRMVVIASQDFALNALLREDVVYDHGRDLILNALGWLSQRESLLGIRAREREHVKLMLLPEQLERMRLMCLLGLPGFALGLGVVVLWRRRR
ncbi:MAG: Gldg family protein, partial [Nannocystaceae bacterium]